MRHSPVGPKEINSPEVPVVPCSLLGPMVKRNSLELVVRRSSEEPKEICSPEEPEAQSNLEEPEVKRML